MILIFCSKYDYEINHLHSQLKLIGSDVEIMYLEDLYNCRDWTIRQSDDRLIASVILPNGRMVDQNSVDLFLNRVNRIHHPYWDKMQSFEHQYFIQQWNSFMFQWLSVFNPVLINKPYPGNLAGFSASPVKWQVLARQAGFQIREQYFSSDYCDPSKLQVARLSPDLKRIQVFNGKVIAPLLPAEINKACISLSEITESKMLEIYLAYEKGNYYFRWANSLPELSRFPASFIHALWSQATVYMEFERKLQVGI